MPATRSAPHDPEVGRRAPGASTTAATTARGQSSYLLHAAGFWPAMTSGGLATGWGILGKAGGSLFSPTPATLT